MNFTEGPCDVCFEDQYCVRVVATVAPMTPLVTWNFTRSVNVCKRCMDNKPGAVNLLLEFDGDES